ncbi:MAG: hypothetical protein ACLRR6_01510 [Oscillospiraceae bacterium]
MKEHEEDPCHPLRRPDARVPRRCSQRRRSPPDHDHHHDGLPSTYVLTIPATVEIPYGEKNATIGSVKVTGRITNDQYVKVTAETTTNFCLVNDSDSSARISYRPEDIFASAVNGSAPIFRGRDFSAKEVNGNGGSCLVVARISDYAWEHAAAGTYSDTITFTASLETANAAG